MWAHGVLRLLSQQARNEALSCDEAPDYAVDGAGRGLGLVLRGRNGAGFFEEALNGNCLLTRVTAEPLL